MEALAQEAEPYAHRRWLVSSDPDEHVEQIAPYLAYGFNHLVFHFPGNDQEAAIARYGELILPRLRARASADRAPRPLIGRLVRRGRVGRAGPAAAGPVSRSGLRRPRRRRDGR